MRWVFEEGLMEEDTLNEFKDFLTRVDLPFSLIKMVPFTRDLKPEKMDTSEPMIALGCYDFAYKIKSLGWTPGVWQNENFNYKEWSQHWLIVNDDGQLFKFAEVPFQETPFFIRPVADDKTFTGKVMDWSEYEEVLTALKEDRLPPAFYHLTADTEVVIAKPKKISEEYRVLIVGGLPITASLYKSGTVGMRRNADNNVALFEFAKSQADVWTPDDVFIMDVAVVNGEFLVMEMGCFNAAGLYKMDVQKIVMSIENLFG